MDHVPPIRRSVDPYVDAWIGHDAPVSHKAMLLWLMFGVTMAGGLVVALGLAAGEAVLVVLGAIAASLGVAGAAQTIRWLRPSTRLPEHLRRSAHWGEVVSLEVSDGTRITCVMVRPGGFVVPRRTDPPFDARQVVAVVPATEADFEAERARQQSAS